MKDRKKLPEVFISQTAALKAFREAGKFFELGKSLNQGPFEAAMYPLAYLLLKEASHKSPLEFIELKEIQRIVVTHILYPLDKFKNYSPGHAEFKPGATAYLNPLIEKHIARYPLLDAFSKMHSHPKGFAYLSQGDLTHSVFNAYDWFRQKGLNTMLSFILTSVNGKDWNISCFGLNHLAINVRLPVTIIPRSHAFVKEALSLPYYQTEAGSNWCDRTKASLIQAGYQVSRNILNRGWRRYTIAINREKFVFCLPPFFPRQTIKVFRITNDCNHPFEEIVLAPEMLWLKSSNQFTNLDLLTLVKWIENNYGDSNER